MHTLGGARLLGIRCARAAGTGRSKKQQQQQQHKGDGSKVETGPPVPASKAEMTDEWLHERMMYALRPLTTKPETQRVASLGPFLHNYLLDPVFQPRFTPYDYVLRKEDQTPLMTPRNADIPKPVFFVSKRHERLPSHRVEYHEDEIEEILQALAEKPEAPHVPLIEEIRGPPGPKWAYQRK
eukprot:TRINITY_DN1023_c0_g1_i1.p1 TRINITY_DN1023_c0_g1~~TRINITY_DN1023_c0_g1_i1.p1  ORF type:complete len:191 (+),score=36.76 TRINITY_DN1023_c0_g1_i1:29-574(+)